MFGNARVNFASCTLPRPGTKPKLSEYTKVMRPLVTLARRWLPSKLHSRNMRSTVSKEKSSCCNAPCAAEAARERLPKFLFGSFTFKARARSAMACSPLGPYFGISAGYGACLECLNKVARILKLDVQHRGAVHQARRASCKQWRGFSHTMRSMYNFRPLLMCRGIVALRGMRHFLCRHEACRLLA